MLPRLSMVVAVYLVAVHMACQPNKCSNKENSYPDKEPTVTCSGYIQPKSPRAPQDAHGDPPYWYTPIERPQWWLVILTAATAIAIGWQAVETRKAAQVAQKSIKVVAAENRPWLLVGFGDGGKTISTPVKVPDLPASCTFYIGNYGKTPAELLTVRADLVIWGSAKYSPPGEITEASHRSNPQIFPQGDFLPQEAELLVGTEKDFREAVLGNGREAKKHLWLRGVIQYKHTVEAKDSPIYRTEFCYVWIAGPDYWRLIESKAK